MNEQDYLVHVAKGKPDTALAGKEFHLHLHKKVLRECWISSVLYGGEPTDYLTPGLLAKYPCPIQERHAQFPK